MASGASTHAYGLAALDDLAHDLRVRRVVHGHHHRSCTGVATHGIKVIGLAEPELPVLCGGDLG